MYLYGCVESSNELKQARRSNAISTAERLRALGTNLSHYGARTFAGSLAKTSL